MFNAHHFSVRLLAVVLTLASAGLLGTSASARAATSVLSPTPASWDFGNDDIHSGGGPSQTFTFTNNTAGTNVNVAADPNPVVVGLDVADFQLNSNNCPAAFLRPGDFCSVQVTFQADSTGAKSAALELTDDSGTLDVPLTGSGITGTLTANPNPLNFTPQPYFNGGQQQGINIQNSNDAGTQATSGTITGPDASRFYIAYGQNCTNQQYGPGNGCGMGVGFNPPNGPGTFHAQLEISSDSLSSPLIIPLNATALNGPHAVVGPLQTDFGDLAIGRSASQTVTVSNDGDAPMQIQQAFMVTGTPSIFPITHDGCSGQVVNQGSSCQFTVRFEPTAAGFREGAVIIINNTPTPVTPIGFTGTGVPSPSGTATITGNPAAASTLTCNPVGYPGATVYSYQWLRNGQTLPGATAASYTPSDGDVGSQLACRLTATNPVGTETVTSAPTGPVAAMDLSRLAGSFVDAGTCRTIGVARQLHAGSTVVTVSYPQPSLPWAPLILSARQTVFASIDGQAAGIGRRIKISPRTLAAYSDGAHTLKVTTRGESVKTPLLLAPCLLAVRVDGGARQSALISLASRAAMTSATITLPRGLHLQVSSRKLGKFSYRQAGYPARTFDIVGSHTTTNNVTVSITRHTIRIRNLPARTGVIRFTTRPSVLAGSGGTARATATLADAQGQQTSSVPATWLR